VDEGPWGLEKVDAKLHAAKMKEVSTEPMNASEQFCPNPCCSARGEIGQGNIVVHGKERPRYKCKTCGRTFSAKAGTMFAGLRKPEKLVVIVITLLAYGCPLQAVVHAFNLDERTVANWRDRAGLHCEKVHKDKIEQGNIDLKHVQADEIRVKGRGVILWMGLAIMVPTRLWIAGAVSGTRDRKLIDCLMQQVRRCCKCLSTLLVCTDGFAAYPNSIRRAFREKLKNTAGRGRCRLEVWKDLHIGTVIKRTVKMRLKEVLREMAHGSMEQAQKILQSSKGGTMINTSFIERLNGTFRERLASLTRKCRHATSKVHTFHTGMYLVGCTYNFCFPHHELSKSVSKGGFGMPYTPAMATGLTDHIWSIVELLRYKVVPTPLPVPKKRGRPRTKSLPDSSVPKRPRGRPRKETIGSSTS
jgi:transposase-like protein/IS1 family transposase